MYAAYIIFSVGALFFSLASFKNLLHPHFIFTSIIVVLFASDFIARGYSDRTLLFIPNSSVGGYQIFVLSVCLGLTLGAYLISRSLPNIKGRLPIVTRGEKIFFKVSVVAWFLLLLLIAQRLYSTGWSVSDLVSASLGPRGGRPWTTTRVNLGDNRFLYALTGIVFPMSGLLFGYLLVFGRGLKRGLALAGYLLVIAILITDGSRTPVAIIVASLVMFYWQRPKIIMRKIVVTVVVTALLVASMSLIYLSRTEGVGKFFGVGAGVPSNGSYALVYHQDDSYYRALYALHHSSVSMERWDPVYFFSTILVHPIPRVFWPGKPALLQDFWGGYKDYWVTITYLGELVAMFGPALGFLATLFLGWAIYYFFHRSARLVESRAGIVVYLIFALYVYMVMRSLMNLTHFMYFPILGYLIYRHMSRRSARRRNKMGVGVGPVHREVSN